MLEVSFFVVVVAVDLLLLAYRSPPESQGELIIDFPPPKDPSSRPRRAAKSPFASAQATGSVSVPF